MNITVFIGGISGGGAERVACNLANYLVDKGNEVKLLTMSDTPNSYGLKTSVERNNLLKENERSNKVFENLRRYFRLKKYIKQHPNDIYIVFLPVTICLLLHFSKKINGPIIATERNDPKKYSKIQQVLLQYYANKADKWIFQTEEASEWYSRKVRQSVVIPNAINPDFLVDIETPKKLDNVIVAVGRLNKQKNYKLLIDSFDVVVKSHPDYKLKIYGKGPLEQELREYANGKKCAQKIEFCGYVNNMKERLVEAKIYVISSDYEGMPNALMEAMAVGLPCISTDCPCGGPRFLIKDHENGILVPVNDINKMSLAINELIENEELRKQFSIRAREIKEMLSPDKIYQQWESVILENKKSYHSWR
ncbi:glycosyltransferase family 4 protein [Thomasclavelia spiroformis]|uniref:glycosyltransferase family 4 protein n=1 Tax=Thomasclavelia spiroformis TaxID=29348 RepID=UPI00241C5B00|nr:glycosyltransferase family 4 protein [Thomasclavelia spiroformis]